MSIFLNTKQIDIAHVKPVVSWKGKTLSQITSSIRKNNVNTIGSPLTTTIISSNKPLVISYYRNIFLPNPLKIYRREIANTTDATQCYPRTSLRIDEFNRPGGSINNSSVSVTNSLVNTLDDTLPNNTCERPGTCSTFLSASENAKRRCRSSGMIRKTYNPANNSASYYTDSKQYLVSRNKTFLQNQYNYIRVGDPLLKPAPGQAAANIYSPNGVLVCPKYHISTICTFQYQWVDGTYYTVSIPVGYYDANDFNGLLQLAMSANYHFLINSSGSKVFLLFISYDDVKNVIEFQNFCYDNVNFPASIYSCDIRSNQAWTLHNAGTGISPPNQGSGTSLTPGFKFTDNALSTALGLPTSSYPYYIPSTNINVTNIGQSGGNQQTYTTTQVTISKTNPGLKSVYKKIYYKPNNSQFAQQGAVSSSSLITRIKYDTINTAAFKTSGNIFGDDATKAYGGNIANALAYGVSENPFTMKDKIGYPNISYPSFLPNSNVQRKCTERHTGGGFKNPLN